MFVSKALYETLNSDGVMQSSGEVRDDPPQLNIIGKNATLMTRLAMWDSEGVVEMTIQCGYVTFVSPEDFEKSNALKEICGPSVLAATASPTATLQSSTLTRSSIHRTALYPTSTSTDDYGWEIPTYSVEVARWSGWRSLDGQGGGR